MDLEGLVPGATVQWQESSFQLEANAHHPQVHTDIHLFYTLIMSPVFDSITLCWQRCLQHFLGQIGPLLIPQMKNYS